MGKEKKKLLTGNKLPSIEDINSKLVNTGVNLQWTSISSASNWNTPFVFKCALFWIQTLNLCLWSMLLSTFCSFTIFHGEKDGTCKFYYNAMHV